MNVHDFIAVTEQALAAAEKVATVAASFGIPGVSTVAAVAAAALPVAQQIAARVEDVNDVLTTDDPAALKGLIDKLEAVASQEETQVEIDEKARLAQG